jgi:hypothetical protein
MYKSIRTKMLAYSTNESVADIVRNKELLLFKVREEDLALSKASLTPEQNALLIFSFQDKYPEHSLEKENSDFFSGYIPQGDYYSRKIAEETITWDPKEGMIIHTPDFAKKQRDKSAIKEIERMYYFYWDYKQA